MRVCLFTPTFLPLLGGAERMADTLARGLLERGHAVQVLTQHHPHADPRPDPRRELPYPVHHYRRLPAQHLWPEALSLSLRRLYARHPFDAVLAFYAYPCGFAAVHARRRLGVPVVVTPRGADLYPHFHSLRKPRVRATIAAGYARADRIVSISRWLTQRIVEVTGRPLADLPPVDQVPNGLDLAQFDAALAAAARGTLPLQEGERFVLQLGRIEPVKQPELAVRAVALLAPEFRQQGIRYVMVGDGSALPAVRVLAAELGVSDVLLFPGARRGAEKAWLLRHAACFVTTSREEGMPNAVLEAMAAGLPTVASDIDPHHELIEGRGWGELFTSGDAEALALSLRAMLSADVAPYRAAALALREQYTLERTLDGYEAALHAAVAARQ